MAQFGNGLTYLNFTGLVDEPASTGVDSALGRNLLRLAEAKETYDPDNFFRRQQHRADFLRSSLRSARPRAYEAMFDACRRRA